MIKKYLVDVTRRFPPILVGHAQMIAVNNYLRAYDRLTAEVIKALPELGNGAPDVYALNKAEDEHRAAVMVMAEIGLFPNTLHNRKGNCNCSWCYGQAYWKLVNSFKKL